MSSPTDSSSTHRNRHLSVLWADVSGCPDQRTCSRSCGSRARTTGLHRRQTGLANSPAVRPDIRARGMAAKRRSQWTAGEPLRALEPAAIGALGARSLEVVKLYYGLGDDDRLMSGEIGVRLGLSADRVRRIVCRSVERLLGPAALHVLGKASRSTT